MRSVIIILFALNFLSAQAQEGRLLVLGTKGSVFYKKIQQEIGRKSKKRYTKSKKYSNTRINVGAFLDSSKTLVFSGHSYLSIMHPSGTILEIWQTGAKQASVQSFYTVKSLQDSLSVKKHIKQSYKIGNEPEDPYSFVIIDGFYRCDPPNDLIMKNYQINYLWEFKGFLLKWSDREQIKAPLDTQKYTYEIIIRDCFDEELITYQTEDTTFYLDFTQEIFKKQLIEDFSQFVIEVKKDEQRGGRIGITYDEALNQKVLSDLKKINQNYSQTSEMYRKVIKTFYLHAHGYMKEADQLVAQLYKDYPNNIALNSFSLSEFHRSFTGKEVFLGELNLSE